MLNRRAGGILLHLTSLPCRYGVGDFGPDAYAFADFLNAAGATYWQMLPLTATTAKRGDSPYNGISAFAGNPLLISPDLLYREGLLSRQDIQTAKCSTGKSGFAEAVRLKTRLLDAAFERFKALGSNTDYERFCRQNRHWLDDFALFVTLKKKHGVKPWSQWPTPFRNRDPKALNLFRNDHREQIEQVMFVQYIVDHQLSALKNYCNQRGILLFGDVPIYVVYDSADVWANPTLFKLRRDKKPAFIAGVPPDYFSRTGQLWGNPVYNWPANAETGYQWWLSRLKHNLTQFDLLRIDHFRAFEAYWQIPYGRKTAIGGKWIKGPGADFFNAVFRHLPQPAIVAEDLGYITPGVRELIDAYNIPGMRVLQFAFGGGADNPHLPHYHIDNSVVYTGTHDNNTTLGWYRNDITAAIRKHIVDYLGKHPSQKTIVRDMMRLAMASPARLCILPMQDVLELDQSARMNNPARKTGNWHWRMRPGCLKPALARQLRRLMEIYGRV